MNSLVSPFKIFKEDLNIYKLGFESSLGQELRDFLKSSETDELWKLNTHRQTITYALRNTESINIRQLIGIPKKVTTAESSKYMEIDWTSTANIPIINKSMMWFTSMLEKSGASSIEFGRVFLSKLSPNSIIDLHTDEGDYFRYFDRFHYTITASSDNKFVIRDKEYILEQDSFYWVNNHVPHWLSNNSNESRINIIIDARLT